MENKEAGRDDGMDLVHTDPIPMPIEKASKEHHNSNDIEKACRGSGLC